MFAFWAFSVPDFGSFRMRQFENMILLHLNKDLYENDIRALLMAFFYGEKISLSAQEWSKQLFVYYGKGSLEAVIEDKEGRTVRLSSDFVEDDYKKGRNQVKKTVYGVLSEYTGKKLPWGTLTGIRPTKLAMEMMEKSRTDKEIISYLTETYLASEGKAELCFEVAQNEKRILDGIDFENSYSLYAGVPFCPSICAYCSFSSYPVDKWKDQTDAYTDALIKEIRAASAMLAGKKPVTFYMGGGTPTSLSAYQLDRILSSIRGSFDLEGVREMTVEAGRPDSIDRDKLKVLKTHGVDRISINPQTMNQQTLDIIGRRHTVEDVKNAFKMAREEGFENINMDLIIGLAGERKEHMIRTMEAVTALSPDNITIHSLALKRAAYLNHNREKFPVAEPSEIWKMSDTGREYAIRSGMEPYYLYRQKNIAGNLENVGYAKRGKEGLYNILIMEEKQTILALGTGASSKFVLKGKESGRIERIENVKSVKDYIERTDEMIGRKQTFILQHEV